MNDGTPFEEMRLNGKPLSECELIIMDCHMDYRLYVDRYTDIEGFCAMAVAFVSCSGSNFSDGDCIWEADELMVEQLFHVIAYFDGVRHLEFNREAGEMAGYMYYPNMEGLIALMQKIRKLEKEICKYAEYSS